MDLRNEIIYGDWIEVLKQLPDGCVHCCITSPPFWGQRLYGWGGDGSCDPKKKLDHIWEDAGIIQVCKRCGMKAPTLGLEKTPEEHIENLVVGFREIRRVLRDDGCVFLNYGDKYSRSGGDHKKHQKNDASFQTGLLRGSRDTIGIGKSGDLLGLHWRLALALQADKWYLRSAIVWAKGLSFCDEYSGSVMPESVAGWRWERHKIKIKGVWDSDMPHPSKQKNGCTNIQPGKLAEWADCPGCPKCKPNDGLVLRKGSWRPTKAYEMMFLLTKTDSYFCDQEAVREEGQDWGIREPKISKDKMDKGQSWNEMRTYSGCNPSGRNLRDVWCINPQSYPDAHYATFPEKLVEPCIKAGTSEKGCCPKCGSPWARIIDKPDNPYKDTRSFGANRTCGQGLPGHPTIEKWFNENPMQTLGWRPTCSCHKADGHKLEPVPCLVMDPFCGSGTVCAEAVKLGRDYFGIDINPEYVKDHAIRRTKEAETGVTVPEQKQGQMGLFWHGC